MWHLINYSALIGGKFICQKKSFDLLSTLNAVISTNEKSWIYHDHMTYNLAYT